MPRHSVRISSVPRDSHSPPALIHIPFPPSPAFQRLAFFPLKERHRGIAPPLNTIEARVGRGGHAQRCEALACVVGERIARLVTPHHAIPLSRSVSLATRVSIHRAKHMPEKSYRARVPPGFLTSVRCSQRVHEFYHAATARTDFRCDDFVEDVMKIQIR